MRKFLAWCVIVGMVCSMAGCGKSETTTTADSTVTLTWYINCSNQAGAGEVMDKINERLEREIGAKLDAKFIDPGAYNDRMNMNMASGTEFDLCFTGYVNKYSNAVKQGGLMGISDIIDKEAPQLWDLIPDYAWKAITLNDEVYAVPNVQLYAMPPALFLQKDMVEKYQFDYEGMHSIDDLVPFMEKIKINEPNKFAFQPSFGVGPWVSDYETVITGFNELVVRKDDENCKAMLRYETPEYLEGIHTLRNWYQQGYIRKDVSSADDSDAVAQEKTVGFTGSYKPGIIADLKSTRRHDYVYKILADNYITSELCQQTLVGVGATSKHPDKAVELLYLLHSDKEFYNLLCHGIEGKHYNKIGENFYKPLENTAYNPGRDWMFGNQFNSYILEGKEATVWEESKELNENAKRSHLLGFNFDPSAVVNEISICTAIMGEYKDLENGSVDVESTLASFSQKMKDGGIDRILAELQRQIDEFIK